MNSDRINELRLRYQRSLAEKAESISKLLVQVREQALEKDDLQVAVHEYLHKLAGSSGMYGYQDIADLCRKTLEELETNELAGLAERLVQIRNLLQQHA